jgi:hypothetical protein
MSRGPIPDKPFNRPTAAIAKERVRSFLAMPGNENGGNLHVVLADQNETDGHIEACLERAKTEDDRPAVELAELLLSLTRTQRRKVCRL